MTLHVGKPVEIKADVRYIEHNRDHTIKDVYHALVELITNSDDSYHRLYKRKVWPKEGGDILIQCWHHRKGQSSQIIVRDRAEGMNTSDMEAHLLHLGRHSSEEGDRGYMGVVQRTVQH